MFRALRRWPRSSFLRLLEHEIDHMCSSQGPQDYPVVKWPADICSCCQLWCSPMGSPLSHGFRKFLCLSIKPVLSRSPASNSVIEMIHILLEGKGEEGGKERRKEGKEERKEGQVTASQFGWDIMLWKRNRKAWTEKPFFPWSDCPGR